MSYEPDPSLQHLPPQNIEMEESLIVTILRSPGEMEIISDLITPGDFYRTANGKIYQACLDLYRKETPADLIAVVNRLKEKGQLEEVGGAAHITQMETISPGLGSIEHGCKVLTEKAALRRGIEIANKFTQQAFEDRGNAVEIIDDFHRQITAIDFNTGSGNTEHVGEILNRFIDRLETLSNSTCNITGHPTGFAMLDQMTCGWQPSDLIILAGRPSMGKTALALRLALTMGAEDIPGLIFSLEMSKAQLMMRLTAMDGRINTQKLRTGQIFPSEWSDLAESASRINEMPMWIEDSAATHYNQVRRIARRYARKHKIKYVICDYLQLMKGDHPDNVFQDAGTITKGCKQLAKELDIPVFVLSQLNRKLEQRSNKRPILSDLRNSGDIEQDADVVLGLYRDEVYNDDENNPNKGRAEIIILKQRNGPTGTVEAAWIGPYTRFEPLAHSWE